MSAFRCPKLIFYSCFKVIFLLMFAYFCSDHISYVNVISEYNRLVKLSMRIFLQFLNVSIILALQLKFIALYSNPRGYFRIKTSSTPPVSSHTHFSLQFRPPEGKEGAKRNKSAFLNYSESNGSPGSRMTSCAVSKCCYCTHPTLPANT